MKLRCDHRWTAIDFDGGWFEYCYECKSSRMAAAFPQDCPHCETHQKIYGNLNKPIECSKCGAIFPVDFKPYLKPNNG